MATRKTHRILRRESIRIGSTALVLAMAAAMAPGYVLGSSHYAGAAESVSTPSSVTQNVTFGVMIDGAPVMSDGDNSAAEELPESVRDVVVTLTGEDGTEFKSNDNGATWLGSKDLPVVQNFGLAAVPAGTYQVSITGLDDIDKDSLKLKADSQLRDGVTVQITGDTPNFVVELEKVVTQNVTFGVMIDGAPVMSDGDNSAAEELPESVRDVVVTLTGEDGTEFKSNDNGATWLGSKDLPVVQNFGLAAVPAGTYQVSITGLDDIDKDSLKLKADSQLRDGVTVQITGDTSNFVVELESTDNNTFEPEYEDGTGKPGDKVVIPNDGGPVDDGTTVETDGPGKAEIDDDGNLVVDIDDNAKPGDKIVVIVKDKDGNEIDRVTVTVEKPAAGDNTGNTTEKVVQKPKLARTGVQVAGLAGIAAAMGVAGFGLALVRRRREGEEN